MSLGKVILYSSLIAFSLSPEKIPAITCMPWNLPSEINESGEFVREKTETIPCSVDSNYRSWNRKGTVMSHDMKKPILRIDYKNGRELYSEFWDGRNLISLLADKLYHFNH